MLMIIFGSSWIAAQRAAQQLGLETESSANRIDFGSETSVLVLFRVIHTGSPLDLHSFSTRYRLLQDTVQP